MADQTGQHLGDLLVFVADLDSLGFRDVSTLDGNDELRPRFAARSLRTITIWAKCRSVDCSNPSEIDDAHRSDDEPSCSFKRRSRLNDGR